MPQHLPERIENVAELESILSTPSDALVNEISGIDGDIMILGAGGKVGPTMALKARRAIEAAGMKKDVVAVDVFELPALKKAGIKTLQCDLLDPAAVDALPRVENIIYMVGRKFGSVGSEWLTWAINVMVPHNVARVFTASRIAAFSTGCVYPVAHIYSGGSVEQDAPDPVGEYAMSCLGRERMFDYYAAEHGERVVHIRLNYAVDLRYGVLFDIATKVWGGEPVDVTTGFANVIWQGDACEQVIRGLPQATSPASVLNITGPEMFSIRQVAQQFGRIMDKAVAFSGEENGRGYLNNAGKAAGLFGYPSVSLDRLVRWTAHWVMSGGENLGKPTHFETQDGKY